MTEENQSTTPSSTPPKVKLGLSVAVVAAVFTASLGLGHLVSRSPKSEEAAAASKTANADIVYKIPVSVSQVKLGPEDALVTLVEWCDLPDQGCRRAEPGLQAMLKRYPKELRLVFRHHPTGARADSSIAHQFARAAYEQAGKFWEARELLLNHQGELTRADIDNYATQLGMNPVAVKRALDEGTFSGQVAADRIFAAMFDVKATPAFFANGRPLVGEPTEAALNALIKTEIERAQKLVDKGTPKGELYAELTKNGVWNPPVRPTAH